MSRVFNGTSDLITLATSASLNSLLPAFTLMAWVNPANLQVGFNTPFFLGEVILLELNDLGGMAGSVITNATQGYTEKDTTNIANNAWAHVAMAYNDNGDRLTHLFLNGVELVAPFAQQTAATGTVSIAGAADGIGADAAASVFWHGDIAEVRFYNTILTAAQITAAMNSSCPAVPSAVSANLQAYLHLAGTTSPEPDSSGNGNVGILTGTTGGTDPPGLSPCSPSVINSGVPLGNAIFDYDFTDDSVLCELQTGTLV